MRSLRRALPAALAVVLLGAAPALAATPSSGRVTLAQPATSWTGSAPGYAATVVNSLGVRTCQQPVCDLFGLDVGELGDLAVTVTANGTSGFTQVVVVRPDGTLLAADGGADSPTTQLRVKRALPGRYRVEVHTNAPAVIGDPTYRAVAELALPRGVTGPAPSPAAGTGEGGPKDATVIAVVDTGINPYHWDFLASRMPQQRNADPGDDLPLDRPAAAWLPGFPADFASVNRVGLSIEETDAGQPTDELRDLDAERWAAIPTSDDSGRHLAWFPGTKVIGALTYDGSLLGADDAHGVGTTSVSVGNQHGTCPECLLFFIQLPPAGSVAGYERAQAVIDWAMSQPWIDAVSNSYGFSIVGGYVRDNVYAGAVDAQRTASERGQSVFFSAGNGIDNAFVVPNWTEFSSLKGPDWILTVGASTPGEDGVYDPIFDEDVPDEPSGDMVGAGKPVDVAGMGIEYPSAWYAETVSGTGSLGFNGTSNATPQVAGLYARTLYLARRALAGTSRTQAGGVVAAGPKVTCGSARPACELGDGVLTAAELRTRLFHGAVHTAGGLTAGGVGTPNPTLPPVDEAELAAEGHGTYLGRSQKDPGHWLAEQDRVFGPLLGFAGTLTRPAGERDWMVVDSYCRQANWGAWSGGYWRTPDPLPADDPAWPVRTARKQICPGGEL